MPHLSFVDFSMPSRNQDFFVLGGRKLTSWWLKAKEKKKKGKMVNWLMWLNFTHSCPQAWLAPRAKITLSLTF